MYTYFVQNCDKLYLSMCFVDVSVSEEMLMICVNLWSLSSFLCSVFHSLLLMKSVRTNWIRFVTWLIVVTIWLV